MCSESWQPIKRAALLVFGMLEYELKKELSAFILRFGS